MWFNILKVEDIDFDKEIGAMGQYSEGIDINNRQEFNAFMNKLLNDKMFSSKDPEMKDYIEEKIRINHHQINGHLTAKLGHPPTDKQLIDYITRVIMHEATHAGMGSEQDSMAAHQAEYGAYTGQFPESTYIRLKEFLKHPATKRILFPPDLAAMMGIDPSTTYRTPDITQKVMEIVGFIDGVTDSMPNNSKTNSIKEELTRLEITARQQGRHLIREFPNFESAEEIYSFMLARYGNDNKDIVDAIHTANGNEIPTQKAAMAVTTTSSPSMFNNKVIRRKKKKREDWA
jgi:hypothetical protein